MRSDAFREADLIILGARTNHLLDQSFAGRFGAAGAEAAGKQSAQPRGAFLSHGRTEDTFRCWREDGEPIEPYA
jgi:hypothetical protein